MMGALLDVAELFAGFLELADLVYLDADNQLTVEETKIHLE